MFCVLTTNIDARGTNSFSLIFRIKDYRNNVKFQQKLVIINLSNYLALMHNINEVDSDATKMSNSLKNKYVRL